MTAANLPDEPTWTITRAQLTDALGNVSWDVMEGTTEAIADAILSQIRPDVVLVAYGAGPLLDPDCRDGKCGSCVGAPCEHDCHVAVAGARHR